MTIYDARGGPALVPAHPAAAADPAQRRAAGRPARCCSSCSPGCWCGTRCTARPTCATAARWCWPTAPTSAAEQWRDQLVARSQRRAAALRAARRARRQRARRGRGVPGGRPGAAAAAAGHHAPPSTSPGRRSTSGSATSARTTRWPSWPPPSTPCWTGSAPRSRPRNGSWPTPRTSCAPRWPCMRTEVDVTLADPDADIAEYRRMAKVVRDGSERANALVDALLVLARSEAQAGRRLSRKVPADLSTGVTLGAVGDAQGVRPDPPRRRDRPGAGPGGRRPRPAGPAGRQPDRERGPLQPPARPDLGPHRRRRRRTPGWSCATPASRWTPADVPGLFEPFRRGGRERTGGRGSGLGLSIVRAVAEAHGGTGRRGVQPRRRRAGGHGDPAGRGHHPGRGRHRRRPVARSDVPTLRPRRPPSRSDGCRRDGSATS